ncbi:GIY-YIG nuclease family protein [Shouchella lonarensis]|uniref:DUF4357 domain-containing protein n=1 Tax=Shouchella lonarensis TaxID=1464122 RepID=A0A1G6H8Q6_9BACI|nr:GIY-YIG nuclease family protein [Shouchella lonarensis]SDB90650.1 protein of unknown function [Shouchella lonarensis]
MTVRGKSINLFLMDGHANGRVKCTLANWTGVVYKIPRTELEKCKEREHLSQSGVYFLFGTSDQTEENVVYIGQAGVRKNGEGILSRLQEHKRNPEKGYWTEVVVFTTSNNSFGPTEISYLENRFCSMAVKAQRYEVKNGNEPTPGNITEEKESELEAFIDYAKIIMGTLGHQVFEPKRVTSDNLKLYLTWGVDQEFKAVGKRTSEGFVVLKNSHVKKEDVNSIPLATKERREIARRKGLISKNGILKEDELFHSPSAAAKFVLGSSVNGLKYWKDKDGKTLKEIQEDE